MEGWKVGYEVGEDGWYTGNQLSVYEANARYTHNAEAGSKGENPFH